MKAKNVMITTLVLAVFLLVSNVSFSQNVKKNEKEIKITTSAVCGMCKTRVEEGLAFEKGVKDVVLDLDTKVLTVVYNTKKTNEEQILTIINNMGYDANDTKANPEAYNKLPACCKNHDGHKCTH